MFTRKFLFSVVIKICSMTNLVLGGEFMNVSELVEAYCFLVGGS